MELVGIFIGWIKKVLAARAIAMATNATSKISRKVELGYGLIKETTVLSNAFTESLMAPVGADWQSNTFKSAAFSLISATSSGAITSWREARSFNTLLW